MTTQLFRKHLISLVICMFSVSALIADDFLGKADIGTGSASSTATAKKPEANPAHAPTATAMAPKRKTIPFDDFKAHLLRYTDGNFKEVTADDLGDSNIEYYAFYFSAHWCTPCRKFTPKLVAAYNELKKTHHNFEVIFISWDRSQHDMFDYVKATEMPWLILKYDKLHTTTVEKESKVEGIPTLLVFNKDGKLVAGSTQGYVSPDKVLSAFEDLVKKK